MNVDFNLRAKAYREAGHALVCAFLRVASIEKVSILPNISTGRESGMLTDGETLELYQDYENLMAVYAAGYVSQTEFAKEIGSHKNKIIASISAAGDELVKAEALISRFNAHRAKISRAASLYNLDSDALMDEILSDLSLERGIELARKTIAENQAALDRLAETLLECRELDGSQVYQVLGVNPPS